MAFPSITRVASKNPKLFLALIAVVGVCSAAILALQETAPDSGAARTGLVVVMFVVAAIYVGLTHEEPDE
ncbi:hypothetical protein BV210_10440 [Halorientalis sp. IM1011]|uniref:hypothetical protein n=1 Tax=Halorientalis sp. IM1011 TaxID=1932360 RepID=UPI00097CC86F|nr:hypothetical protein [Halorientalis sp. IM1011]AQL43107.1 hypothetical protein BV210_10440 [Halorientalis sp. IM1011]